MSPQPNKNRANRRRQRGPQRVQMDLSTIRPPTYDPNVYVKLKRRYFNGGSSSANPCNVATIAESLGMTCTATNSIAVSTFGWFRIRRVQIWGVPPASGGSISSAAIIWGYQNASTQSDFSLNKDVRDTSSSTAYVPYINATPPAGSLASFWQNEIDSTGARRTGVANVLFSIACSQGSIIEIDFDAVMWDAGKSVIRPSTAITSGTASAYAYAALDGVGGVLTPDGVDFFT